MSRQKRKHGKTVHVSWEHAIDTFFQEMLGGVGRLQKGVGVTLFLKDTVENTRWGGYKLSSAASI